VQADAFITNFLAHGLYPGLIGVLVLCGLGLPIPEELTFLMAGFECHREGGTILNGSVPLLCLCGLLGIMLGDSIPYWLGHHYGMSLLKRPWIARFLPAHRVEKTQKFFESHGSKAIFSARFVAGLRMPAFFLTGAMGVKYHRFFLWDFLGALISCPTSILLAWYFGHIAEHYLKDIKLIVAVILGIGIVAFLTIRWLKKKGPPSVELETPAERIGQTSVNAERIPTVTPQTVQRAEAHK
jgi:membrane protein DedA with SNARE-associated domain